MCSGRYIVVSPDDQRLSTVLNEAMRYGGNASVGFISSPASSALPVPIRSSERRTMWEILFMADGVWKSSKIDQGY